MLDLIISLALKQPSRMGERVVSTARRAALRCDRPIFKSIWMIAITSCLFAGCSGGTALEGLTEARRLSADLFIQFTRASNAANQAVMADTDEASIASPDRLKRQSSAGRRCAPRLAA
jgi:hypothetical protein